MDSLSKTEKNSFALGWQQEWKVAGCDEAEGRREEQGPVAGCPWYGSRAGKPAAAAGTPRLHCMEGAHGIAASFSQGWIDLAWPDEGGFYPLSTISQLRNPVHIANTQQMQPRPLVPPAQAPEGKDSPVPWHYRHPSICTGCTQPGQ